MSSLVTNAEALVVRKPESGQEITTETGTTESATLPLHHNPTHVGIGRFWWEGSLCKKKETRLHRIFDYFDEECLKTMLLPIIEKEGSLSLRALDWLVTNYSKKVPVVYTVTPPNKPEILFNLHREYKDWLRNHKRKNFDPFRRGQRIFFDIGDKTYESTVGQLNFFFWASRYGVLDYARANIEQIEKDQAIATKHHNVARGAKKDVDGGDEEGDENGDHDRGQEQATASVGVDSDDGGAATASTKKRRRDASAATPGKRKRRQLSQAPKESVFVYPATVRVVFNPELAEPTF